MQGLKAKQTIKGLMGLLETKKRNNFYNTWMKVLSCIKNMKNPLITVYQEKWLVLVCHCL